MRIFRWSASVLIAVFTTMPVEAGEVASRSTSDRPPNKVIIGTMMKGFWVEYPGLQNRLQELTGSIDKMAEQARRQYGRGLDLAVLPELAVTGEQVEAAIPFDGAVKDAFATEARKQHCYVVVPMYLLEDAAKNIRTNVAILVGRNGDVVGTYRKVHLAVATGSDSFEGGATPGKQVSTFECDFGRLGIQICFDMDFDYGWTELARQGAQLVAWPTQWPGTSRPAFRAYANRYYIVSSTWRNNASVFEPTGKITAQVKPPGETLVQEVDLSYAILPWSSRLRNGNAFTEKYGDKAGFRYYEDEDLGLFWSNDPQTSVRRMVRALGLTENEEELERIRKLYDKAGLHGR